MKFLWRLLKMSLLIGIVLYTMGMIAGLALRMTYGESLRLIGLFNSFLPLALLPALALALLALILLPFRRARGTGVRLLIFQLPAVIAFFVLFGWYVTPRSAAASLVDAPRLTVLTFNVNADARAPAAQVEIIRAANADVVGLQELSQAAADRFAAEFAEAYPHQLLRPGGVTGRGILSRYPILDETYWQQDWMPQQRVLLDFDGGAVAYYNLHLPIPFNGRLIFYAGEQRSGALSEALRRIEAESVPVIAAGDFNMSEASVDYWRATQLLRDSYRAVGAAPGFTFSDWSRFNPDLAWIPPVARIDYVFHDEAFAPLAARVWDSSGRSDHRPVWVELALIDAGS